MSNDLFAYSPEWAELEIIMRFHAVKRWHMIDTTRQQTIAEHSANVAALTYLIAMKAPAAFFGPPEVSVVYALSHDMAETLTGDMPSITKNFADIRSHLDKLEQSVIPLMWRIPVHDNIKLMVKLCDLADGIRFIRLHGVDMTARHAKDGIERQFQERIKQADIRGWPTVVTEMVAKTLTFYAYEFS